MNKSYRSVYNEAIGAWVAVSEIPRSARWGSNTSGSGAGAEILAHGGVKKILLALATIGSYSATTAWAACTTADGGITYTCSGITTTAQTLPTSTSGSTVTIDSSFLNSSAVTGSSVKVNAAATGDITVKQAQGATNYSSLQGIYLGSPTATSGNFTVVSGGNVTSTTNTGITVQRTAAGTTASTVIEQLSTGTIQGLTGISASNTGTGSTSITTAGTVIGTGSYGIAASNSGHLTINQTAGSITGATGIYASNTGTGISLTIGGNVTGNGLVGSTLGWGVYISQGGTSSGNVTVNQAASSTVSGISNGIYVSNFAGATSITTSGVVSAQYGINAVNYTAGDLTINQTAGSIKSTGVNRAGINAGNLGTGAISVTTAGTITSGAYGIDANNWSSTATNLTINQTAGSITGNKFGIEAGNYGHGATSITTAGAVSGATVAGIDVHAGTAATDLTINQTAGSITGGQYGIDAQNGGTGTTTISIAGVVAGGQSGVLSYAANGNATNITVAAAVTGGSRAGIDIDTVVGTPVTIDLKNGANVSATSGIAIQKNDGDATVTMESGSKVTGQVLLGNGNDTMAIQGTADISGVTLLDAGNSTTVSVTSAVTGTETAITDILGTSTAATNKLTFQGTTQSVAGSVMKNWETVTLDGSNVTFASDAALVTGTGTNPDGSPQGLVLKNASTLTSPMALAVTGDVAIDARSTLKHSVGGQITGNVTNAGLIYWGNLGQTLTVKGNYTGVSGSLSLQTFFGDDSSPTDKLAIDGGNASGTTALVIRRAGGNGAQTTQGIRVVQTLNGATTNPTAFTLSSLSEGYRGGVGSIVAGAYDYSLIRGGVGGVANDWYLASIGNQCSSNSALCPAVDVGAPVATKPALRPEVGSYLNNRLFAQTMQFHSLHERQGQAPGLISNNLNQGSDANVWVRLVGKTSGRSGADGMDLSDTSYLVHAGGDVLRMKDGRDGSVRVGVMAAYGSGNNQASNGRLSSRGTVDGYNAGLYGTWYGNRDILSGPYVDSWLMFGTFQNKVSGQGLPTERYNARNLAASLEGGYSFPIHDDGTNRMFLEPQAQVIVSNYRADVHTEQNGTVVSEPPWDLRRLQLLREWSHEQDEQVLTRGARARCAHGAGAPRRVSLAMGSR